MSPELSNVYCKKREGKRQALHTPTDRANLGLQCDKRSQYAYGVDVRVGTVLDIGICKCFYLAAIRDQVSVKKKRKAVPCSKGTAVYPYQTRIQLISLFLNDYIPLKTPGSVIYPSPIYWPEAWTGFLDILYTRLSHLLLRHRPLQPTRETTR